MSKVAAAPGGGEADRVATELGDEVLDTPAELAALDAPALRQALEVLGAAIAAPFREADEKALNYQAAFRRIVAVATIAGTGAVLLAVGELAFDRLDRGLVHPLLILELLMLLVAVVAVTRGLFAFLHENWLVERFRAEQLRSLKFEYLVDPSFWCGDEHERENWRAALEAEVRDARSADHDDLRKDARREKLPALPAPDRCATLEPQPLDALIDYYQRKRLGPQCDYFLAASERHRPVERRMLPAFFFVSVGLVLGHALVALVGWGLDTDTLDWLATSFAAGSVMIPVLWAGVRTFKGASETARNASRSGARYHALTQLAERLAEARGDPLRAFWTMGLAEFIMRVDQREWLRLLVDIEWYA